MSPTILVSLLFVSLINSLPHLFLNKAHLWSTQTVTPIPPNWSISPTWRLIQPLNWFTMKNALILKKFRQPSCMHRHHIQCWSRPYFVVYMSRPRPSKTNSILFANTGYRRLIHMRVQSRTNHNSQQMEQAHILHQGSQILMIQIVQNERHLIWWHILKFYYNVKVVPL